METLLALLTAHLLADFVFQTRWMAREKERPAVLLLHVGVVGLATFLILGNFHGPILATILVTHGTLDFAKEKFDKCGGIAFILDQTGHLAVIAVLAVIYPHALSEGWWPVVMDERALAWFHVTLCAVSGVVLIAPAGGIMIGKLLEPISQKLEGKGAAAPAEGLKDGGKYIGWLERLLTLLLVVINQPGGIGFVIAAKSVLRFGEISDSSQRKMSEYIIIGTFLSFGWALLVSVILKAGIGHWMPSLP